MKEYLVKSRLFAILQSLENPGSSRQIAAIKQADHEAKEPKL
jgi:hypothetical protein